MSKASKARKVVAKAEARIAKLKPVAPPPSRPVMQPTSGVERDFREAEGAR